MDRPAARQGPPPAVATWTTYRVIGAVPGRAGTFHETLILSLCTVARGSRGGDGATSGTCPASASGSARWSGPVRSSASASPSASGASSGDGLGEGDGGKATGLATGWATR